MNIHLFYRSIIVIMLSLLVACASTDKIKESNAEDPHEGFNRGMYGFNKGLDTYVSSPMTTVYQFILPGFLRTSVAGFFTNLKEPRTVANDILQGKEQSAGEDFERFVINTLFGLGGLINIASYAEIEYHQEDFAQTLAVWGVPRGEYLVLPFLGPSSYRGVPGEIADAASSPVSYAIWPIQVLDLLNTRSNAEQSLKFIDEAAVDPYIFMRASYLQWRDFHITEGTGGAEKILLDGAFDEDDFDDEDLDLLDDDLDIKL